MSASSSANDTSSPGFLGRAVQVGFLISLALAWYLAAANGLVNKMLLPPPGAVFATLWKILSTGEFLTPLLMTLSEIGASLLIASVVGLTLGYLCSRTGYAIRVYDPLFSSLYAIPSILFYPLFILFFGIGVPSKIAMGTLIAIFPIIMATIAAFSNVDRTYKIAARSMGANETQMFFSVLLPAALPMIASGLRIGIITATGGTLAAEALGSFDGVGHQIVAHTDLFLMPEVFAYVIIAIVMALAITFAAFAIENRASRHA